jgi:hypothetical protein
VIKKDSLTSEQIWAIHNHGKVGKWFEYLFNSENEEGEDYDFSCSDEWSITETDDEITGFTFMDNFCMRGFLEDIGVDMSKVEIDEEG